MRKKKLLKKILNNQENVRFSDFMTVLYAMGFLLDRIEGSHHQMVHPQIPRPLTIQNEKGQAKAYQVRQFIKLMILFDLKWSENDV
jgi:predicted RNA binding protein YcfA (HicA-like mRNA interferase family)